ncbi:autophagy-related protein 23 isoform X2 [Amaranthus tricolor]|uniref:autophagy-related protein 23 isoform X2 n=1 Tax=Amaranthus tricolor TaxID=29722 RepID=UPI00258ED041|nr:autophagy-related protein 23 isoform X2 [Amaranthus tricolor]
MSTNQHHASLGRRTLEEIRQKRAAERVKKVSSGSDLSTSSSPPDYGGIKKSDSVSRFSENDISSLVAQLKDLQKRNAEFEDDNMRLSSKLLAKEVECETLQQRLNDLEQNAVPSLRKALKDIAMEKDAAVVAREDLLAQIRTLKKRLKEAEEEQYRAEEDAASLRAELNSIQQQAFNESAGGMVAMGKSPDQFQSLEKELANLKFELEREAKMRHQEQQKLAEEQARVSALMSEKQDLELKLSELTKTSEEAAGKSSLNVFTLQDKEKLEDQLHAMAVMVERLESGRQKLLLEIDSQSSEIEKLFDENSSLSSAYEEAVGIASHWETQMKECLNKNEELRSMIDGLRTEQINIMSSNSGKISNDSSETNNLGKSDTEPANYTDEVLNLKGQLLREQSKAESLAAEVMQLSLQLQQTTRAYTGLARLYKPVLRNIESSLMKVKNDGALLVK